MGEEATFLKDKLALFEPSPCGSALQIDPGSVEFDRKKGIVPVAFKVIQDGKLIDFRGNGVYQITMTPNHSPKPTLSAVH